MTRSIKRPIEWLINRIHSFGLFVSLLMSVIIGAGLCIGPLRGLVVPALALEVLILGIMALTKPRVNHDLQALLARNAELEAINTRTISMMNAMTQVALVTSDSAGRTLLFSSGAENLFGFSREEMLGKHYADIVHEQAITDRPTVSSQLTHRLYDDVQIAQPQPRAEDLDTPGANEHSHRRKDGSRFTGELRSAQIVAPNTGHVEHINVIIDVSERVELLKKLNENKTFLKLLTQRIPNVLYQYHLRDEGESYFSYCSPSVEQVFELKPEEVMGVGFSNNPVFQRVHPEDLPLIHAATAKSVSTGEPWTCDFRVRLPKKGLRWLRGESYAETQADNAHVWYGSFIDISELKDREMALHAQAVTDELTGIYNRRYFMASLKQYVDSAKRYGSVFSLIMLDLDYFKSINDRWGHEGGDKVLKETCRMIGQRLRSSDVFCRIGGEELAIICPFTPSGQAQVLAELLRQALAGHVIDPVGTVTASFGVASWQTGLDGEALLRLADEATYSAKQQGRNCVRGAN